MKRIKKDLRVSLTLFLLSCSLNGQSLPGCRVVYDFPENINEELPSIIIFYALPNGNSIEQTAGKKVTDSLEWRFDIQHIRAQMEFIRETDSLHNYYLVYLEANNKSWPAHSREFAVPVSSYIKEIERIVEEIDPDAAVYLNSHSGGGRFIFNLIEGIDEIPDYIERISFIDSNYAYDTPTHYDKLKRWLLSSDHNTITIFAYDDTKVILNGKRIVSDTGGTGYRTNLFYEELCRDFADIERNDDSLFVKMTSLHPKAYIFNKKNPEGKIYHTVLVERNGFIHSTLLGTIFESIGYQFWSPERAYEKNIREYPVRFPEPRQL